MGIRYIQAQIVQDQLFRGAIEASVMRVAYEILQSSTTGNPRKAAEAMFRGMGSEKERFITLFGWYVVFQPAAPSWNLWVDGAIDVSQLPDNDVDQLVRGFWPTVASIEYGAPV